MATTESTIAPTTEQTVAAPPAVQTSVAPPDEAETTAESAPADTTSKLVSGDDSKHEPASFKPSTQFRDFAIKLPDIIKEIGHDEMWGVKLSTSSPVEKDVPTQIILQKFLNANEGDIIKAEDQFKAALKYRKERKPLELLEKTFNKSKFGDLGLVTVYKVKDSEVPEVFTWNIYGNVKDRMDEVFVPLEEFIDFRIALQELGLQALNIPAAKEPITETFDPYKMIQVHDYKDIAFFRQNPNVKTASTSVIKLFAQVYPENLKASQLYPSFRLTPPSLPHISQHSEKFFVNVPPIMGMFYSVIKLFVAEKTRKKFHPMSNGANLAAEFRDEKGWNASEELPKEYGGDLGKGDGTLEGIEGTRLKFE